MLLELAVQVHAEDTERDDAGDAHQRPGEALGDDVGVVVAEDVGVVDDGHPPDQTTDHSREQDGADDAAHPGEQVGVGVGVGRGGVDGRGGAGTGELTVGHDDSPLGASTDGAGWCCRWCTTRM